MTSKALSLCDSRRKPWALLAIALVLWPVSQAFAADEPDLIFRRSTVFKWVSPNDKLATYGVDDPEVEGVACHFTVPEKGGFKGWLGLAEQVSDISLAFRQIGPIHFKGKMEQGDDMFRQRRSLFFKKMQIVRGCDAKRNVLVCWPRFCCQHQWCHCPRLPSFVEVGTQRATARNGCGSSG